ncbi:hypothetical protein ACFX2C_007608 [Malus domestica]
MMNDVDWMGITLAGIGTIGVGAGGEEQKASIISVFHLPWLAIVVAFLFVLLNGWLRIYRRQRKEQELMEYEVVEEIIYGLESGILFGMASVILKMGFVFLEQGFHSMLVPICVIISICCSGTRFYYQETKLFQIPGVSSIHLLTYGNVVTYTFVMTQLKENAEVRLQSGFVINVNWWLDGTQATMSGFRSLTRINGMAHPVHVDAKPRLQENLGILSVVSSRTCKRPRYHK